MSGSLDKKLKGVPVPPRQAAQIVETLARAIHAAHLAGVVHRDLKPANILVGQKWALKITDFGLAKKLDDAGQTRSGAVMGTPSYMAPEQASGKGKEVEPAADVYALGAILYELLTGRPPFRAATALDTMLQVVADERKPPRQSAAADAAGHGDDLPEMSPKGGEKAIYHGGGAGRRPGPIRARRAGAGPPGGAHSAGGEVVSAQTCAGDHGRSSDFGAGDGNVGVNAFRALRSGSGDPCGGTQTPCCPWRRV